MSFGIFFGGKDSVGGWVRREEERSREGSEGKGKFELATKKSRSSTSVLPFPLSLLCRYLPSSQPRGDIYKTHCAGKASSLS